MPALLAARFLRPCLLACLAAGVTAGLPSRVGEREGGLAAKVTIYRDSYGIPHVFGETDAAAAFGFGYAQAEDNFARVEDNYIRAIGRRAEVDGEAAFSDDRLNHLLRIPQLAQAEYRGLADHERQLVDGFAAGINLWLAQHPKAPRRLLSRIEPWYPLALIRYLYYQTGFVFAAGVRGSELAVVRDTALVRNTGSNGFVIGPSRSATGHAMLLINPHLPYFGPGQVYEGQVHSESGWNFTGYTRFGFPFPYVGHSDAIGWVSTDNAADQADLWSETFDDPGHPLRYRYGDGYRTATEWTDTLLVRTDRGLTPRVVTFRRTHHGPLVAVRDGHPLALRMARFEEPGWLAEWYRMTRARSMAELRQAMAPLAMLFGNVMGADTAGHIWYLYNGAVPRRDPRFDWSRPVDGSDPATEWRGYHTIDELPELLDPPSGWMQNNNTTPFLLTDRGNPDSSGFPRYMVTEGDNPRGVAARRLLAADSAFTWEAWNRAAFDTRMSTADAYLDRMLAQARGLGAGPDSRQAALALLANWDHRADSASVATTVFCEWAQAIGELPEARQDDPISQSAALDSALARLTRTWGTWQVPWGRVTRLQRIDDLDSRANFGGDGSGVAVPAVPGQFGAIFTMYTTPGKDRRANYGVAGASYVSVVEFGWPVRARAVHVFGASGHPGSAHFMDQSPLFARGEMRPAWMTLDQLRGHLERSYRP